MRWPGTVFFLIALIAACGAFVGLACNSLFIDELFTVHLIHHHDGLVEVYRRALTDTHPPFYYFLLYGWTRLAGLSETALRLPSAVFAIASLVVFAVSCRRLFRRDAIAFACAVAALSPFWFVHSQNARGYALGMLLAAAMLAGALAVFRASRRADGVPWRPLAALWLAGTVASFTHAYLLLALGMVMLYLLLTIRRGATRLAILSAGLVVLVANLGYYRVLLRSTQQDLHHMWFRNSGSFFRHQILDAIHDLLPDVTGLVVAGLLLRLIFHRSAAHSSDADAADDTRWATGLAWMVILGTIIAGVAVSLAVAPSFSSRNVLVCMPFAWLLLARLYDRAGPRPHGIASHVWTAVIVVLIGIHLLGLRERLQPGNEPWRASASYIREQHPQCLTQPLPVVLPFLFGPSTPPFRTLAEQDFFGHYLPEARHLEAVLPSELALRHPYPGMEALFRQRAADADAGDCNVIAWGVHDLDEAAAMKIAQDLARQPALAGHRIVVQELDAYTGPWFHRRRRPEAFVFLLQPLPPPAATIAPDAVTRASSAMGDRWVVTHLATHKGELGPPYRIDVYSIQRWPTRGPASEDFVATPRLTCDPPPTSAREHVWPNPRAPGCSQRLPPSTTTWQ